MIQLKQAEELKGEAVTVYDGDFRVEGPLVAIFKDKLLIELDIDQQVVPPEFTISAVTAAIQGFDLETFPDDKVYIIFSVGELEYIEPVMEEL